jgi:peptidoglycan/xylan/chitin deacetylase (PgdA/CDA1 family)
MACQTREPSQSNLTLKQMRPDSYHIRTNLKTKRVPEIRPPGRVFTYGKIVTTILFVTRSFLYYLFFLLSRITPARNVAVLAYHSIGVNNSYFTVKPEVFGKHIEYLRRNHIIVGLDEIVDFVRGERALPPKSVAITFDDGYYDNYLNVYPLLRKHNLPATIFVSTGYVGSRRRLGDVPLTMLNWNTISEMSQMGITFGAHTVSHPHLPNINLQDARGEILRSKTEIEERIKKDVGYFAHPFGEVDEPLVRLTERLGFKAAFSGEGLVRRGDNPFKLNRISVDSSINFIMFKIGLSVGSEWYRRIEPIVAKLISNLLPTDALQSHMK